MWRRIYPVYKAQLVCFIILEDENTDHYYTVQFIVTTTMETPSWQGLVLAELFRSLPYEFSCFHPPPPVSYILLSRELP